MSDDPIDQEPPKRRGGLLHAVLTNRQLRRQLGSMPADEMTIAISRDDSDSYAHPNWKIGDLDSSQFETLEMAEANEEAAPIDIGFVPRRQITTLGDSTQDDAEYRLVGRLGSGGTGVVFQAHQRAIDREVAIKVLRQELAGNPQSRERFLSEARVIGGLDHPNVIALHEVCQDPALGLFYSMKRIDGTSWDQKIKEQSPEENIEILLRVADAIRYAHSRGLIHRDIKPENVMLGKFGEVLLADWGLAISYGAGDRPQDVNHAIGGTPAYMAPELAMGENDSISYQTDVYLLGAILFQILTGFPPHRGDSLLACIHAAAHNEIRTSDIEGELMDIAMKAMSTDPSDRHDSIDTMIAELNAQRKHNQSVRLMRRARKRTENATSENHYEDYRVADALLMESLEIWPENHRANEARILLHTKFAEAATEQGDLDLAISLYDAAGAGQSEAATAVREERDRRNASEHHASRYSTLFTQSPEAGFLIQISSGTVVEANEMFGRMFGYSNDQVVGKKIPDLNLWACPERRADLVDEFQRTGAIDNFEAKFVHTDGHPIDVLISGRVVELHDERMLVSTIRDISLRKQAETELRRSQQRLRDLQSLAGLATWSYDVRSEKVSWSEEAFLLAGRRPEEGVPTREEYLALIHPEDREKLKTSIDAALESGAAYEVHVRQLGAKGQYRRVLVRGQPIFDEQGNTIEIYGVVVPERPAR